jgi:hypothetical protein
MGILVKGKDLRKLCKEKGTDWTLYHLQESYDNKEITPEDFSLRDLARNMIPSGNELVDNWERDRRKGGHIVAEAVDAVDTGAMANITGQIFFNAIKESMTLEEAIGDQLVTTFPSNIQGPETVPGISESRDEYDGNVAEGEPYPNVGLSEETVTIPAAEKKGGIIDLTREVIIADRTGVLIQRARSGGRGLGIRREKSIIDVVIGAVNPYEYKGEARLTYGDGTTAGEALGFINEATPALVNYTDVQEVAEVFYAIEDPNTNEPLGWTPDTVICTNNLSWTASAVFNDVQTRLGDAVVRAAGATEITSLGSNRIPDKFQVKILSNEWVTRRLIAANGVGGIAAANRAAANLYWFMGKPKQAFVWKEIWPLTVEEAPNNNEAQFTRDVWMRFKASYKGVAGVMEPRLMIRSDGTA